MLPVRSNLSERATSVRFVGTAKASRAGPPGVSDEQKESERELSGKCNEGIKEAVRE